MAYETYKTKKVYSGLQGPGSPSCLERTGESLSDLAARYDIHPNLITKWKQEFQANAEKVFEKGGGDTGDPKVDIEKLYAKIGQLEWIVTF